MSVVSTGRILFVLHEPGYFRLYGSTIVELGRRGWEVQLAFDRPEKRDADQVPEGAGPNVLSIGALPDVVKGPLTDLRAGVDYLRYLEAPFVNARYLRRRSQKSLPARFQFLTRVGRLPRFVVGAGIRVVRALDRRVSPDQRVFDFVQSVAPDVVFVSPLVTLGPSGERQTEVVKSARVQRIPVVVGVASWDHLTSKGLVRVVPDVLAVWNAAQLNEAVDLHRVPQACVKITGAQSLDHWFASTASESTLAFRTRLDITPGRRVILFVGSSRNMAPGTSEVSFVRRWVSALRGAPSAELRHATLLVRPHPTNTDPWHGTEWPAGVVVYPRQYSGIPLSSDEVEDFRQSLLVSDAVVGINTTAMIEAAILKKPVLTVSDPEFTHSQVETLHFAHLPIESGGCALLSPDLDEHVRQLERVLQDPGASVDAATRFVSRFVRPLGLEEPATHHLCREIEKAAGRRWLSRDSVPRRAGDEALLRSRSGTR